MLRSLEIRNFRCLSDVKIDLGPLTVLIGPNGAGKSTLLDAIATMARLTRSPLHLRDGSEFSFGRPGWHGSSGFAQAVFAQEPARDMTFSATLETESGQGSYLLAVGQRDGRLLVVNEKLRWNQISLDLALEPIEIPTRAGPISLRLPRDMSLPARLFSLRHEAADHPVVRAALAVQDALGPSYIHEFVPSRLAAASSHLNMMRGDGQGLVTALDETLGKDRETFARIERDLEEFFPSIKGLTLRSLPRRRTEKELLIRTQAGPGRVIEVPANMAPSGVLVVVALLWILHRRPYAVLGLDEIETHLHPWLLDKVMELIQRMVRGERGERLQVVLATHSPQVLNALGDLDPVRVCEHDPDKGSSIVAPASSAERREDLKTLFHNAVGSMWFSGHLGGVPTLSGEA